MTRKTTTTTTTDNVPLSAAERAEKQQKTKCIKALRQMRKSLAALVLLIKEGKADHKMYLPEYIAAVRLNASAASWEVEELMEEQKDSEE